MDAVKPNSQARFLGEDPAEVGEGECEKSETISVYENGQLMESHLRDGTLMAEEFEERTSSQMQGREKIQDFKHMDEHTVEYTDEHVDKHMVKHMDE